MDETSIRHVLGEILSPVRCGVMSAVVGGRKKKQSKTSQLKSEYFFVIESRLILFVSQAEYTQQWSRASTWRPRVWQSSGSREERPKGKRWVISSAKFLTSLIIFPSADRTGSDSGPEPRSGPDQLRNCWGSEQSSEGESLCEWGVPATLCSHYLCST